MSNIASIYVTKFVDLDSKGNDTEISYGVRIADDYAASYTNIVEKEKLLHMSPAEILELAENIDDRASAIIAHALEHQDGIEISSVYYEWAELGRKPANKI